IEIAETDGSVRIVREGGSVADPDVAASHPFQWASYYAPNGEIRALVSHWHVPLHVVAVTSDDRESVLLPPAPVPPGHGLDSTMVTSRDGTRVQLWMARPRGRAPRGTVLAIHGGPNLVTVDRYDPSAQAWLDAGFAYASVNYRGSVT